MALAVSGWQVGLEAKGHPCGHQHEDFVPGPILGAPVSPPAAEEAALCAQP